MLNISELIGPTLPANEPELRTIVVSTISGSTTVAGNSRTLGNDTDTALLLALRSWSDVVLVGSNTIKAEDYGGVFIDAKTQDQRIALGQRTVPPIAVMSSSLNFDLTTRFFQDGQCPPIVITDNSDSDKLTALKRTGAKVLKVDTLSVEVGVDKLRNAGYQRISCEGGANVYGQLIAAKLIDVWHHTIDPVLTGAIENPISRATNGTMDMHLENAAVDTDGTLFLRYRRAS